MKSLVLLALVVSLVVATFAADDFCYSKVSQACSSGATTGGELSACNAKYGAIERVVPDLQKYVNKHILNSFDFMLLAAHFGNYEKNRPGFNKLYMKLSDDSWADSINLIKHIAKRGGSMDFQLTDSDRPKRSYELSELESLAEALDIEKNVADQALQIHGRVSRLTDGVHDAEIAHYLESNFMPKQSQTIRELAGYSNDLKNLISKSSGDSSLSMFLFDEYLQKA